MRFVYLFFGIVLFFNGGLGLSAQESHGLVNWLTIEEAQKKYKESPKPLLIDFYTDWCGWCKHMIKTTYSNPGIAQYINANFIPVQFDAESKDTIVFNGKTYKPTGTAKRDAHEFAIKMLGGNMSYPTTIFSANNYEYNLLVPGYLDEKKIEPLLIFMVENVWQTTQYDEFSKHFQNTFYDTTFAKKAVKTYDWTELEKLQKKKPKKILVNFGTEFCNTCKVMKTTTFVDTAIADYVNKNFYLVNFDVQRKDTILFKNEKTFPVNVGGFEMHSLALKLSNNRFSLPTMAVLDEELNTIDALNYYQGPERLKPILLFFGSNAYKTKKFQDFIQDYLKPKPAGESKANKKTN